MIDLKEIKELALKASGNSQPVRMFHADEAIFRDIDLSTVHLWEALSPPVVLELIKLLQAADDIAKAYKSPGVNNVVWVAIEHYRIERGME